MTSTRNNRPMSSGVNKSKKRKENNPNPSLGFLLDEKVVPLGLICDGNPKALRPSTAEQRTSA